MFGDAIDYAPVRLRRAKFWPLHPRGVTMSPDGDIWFHPRGGAWCGDFCDGTLAMQGHFIHEMTHVWQAQTRGRWYLALMRHPFCRYGYRLKPGKAFTAYGLEQQAEIARHTFLLRQGKMPGGTSGTLSEYEALLPFRPPARA